MMIALTSTRTVVIFAGTISFLRIELLHVMLIVMTGHGVVAGIVIVVASDVVGCGQVVMSLPGGSIVGRQQRSSHCALSAQILFHVKLQNRLCEAFVQQGKNLLNDEQRI